MKAWWAKLVLTELGGTVAQWWAQKVLNPGLSPFCVEFRCSPSICVGWWALRFSPTIKYMQAVLLSSQRPRPEYWQRHKSGPQARHGGRPLVLSLGWVKCREQRALCIVYSIWPLRNCSARCLKCDATELKFLPWNFLTMCVWLLFYLFFWWFVCGTMPLIFDHQSPINPSLSLSQRLYPR